VTVRRRSGWPVRTERSRLHRQAWSAFVWPTVLVWPSDVRTSRDVLDGSANAVCSNEVWVVEGVFEGLGCGGVGGSAVQVGVLGDGDLGLA
jgi:hypothetical protein